MIYKMKVLGERKRLHCCDLHPRWLIILSCLVRIKPKYFCLWIKEPYSVLFWLDVKSLDVKILSSTGTVVVLAKLHLWVWWSFCFPSASEFDIYEKLGSHLERMMMKQVIFDIGNKNNLIYQIFSLSWQFCPLYPSLMLIWDREELLQCKGETQI